MIINISSRDNPLIKQYIKLREQKKQRTADNRFVLEGARIISDAINEGVNIDFAFYTEDSVLRYPDTVERLVSACGDRAYIITRDLAQRLSDTKGSQEIFCCAFALDKILSFDKINNGGKYLVLNNLQDPGNVGTILRTADAVGVDGVFLCGCCDIYNPKTVRSTMGSLFRVPWCCDYSYPSVIDKLRECSVKTYASVIDKLAVDLKGHEFPKNCALVIGNEGKGLSEAEAALCDERITIKMNGNIDSLNAAMAAGIFLWEMTKR